MSARMRALQRAYIRACHALEKYADTDKIKQDNSEWYAEHSHTYQFWANMFSATWSIIRSEPLKGARNGRIL